MKANTFNLHHHHPMIQRREFMMVLTLFHKSSKLSSPDRKYKPTAEALWNPQGIFHWECPCPSSVSLRNMSTGWRRSFKGNQLQVLAKQVFACAKSCYPLSAAGIQTKLQECFVGQLWCIQNRKMALILAKPTKISKSFSWVEIGQHAATQCPCDH